MNDKTQLSKFKLMAFGIVLALSIFANIVLAVKYRELSIQQNLAWSNGIDQVASAEVRLMSDYQDNPTSEDLVTAKSHIEMLSQQLQTASMLPYGQEIIPFSFVQKVNSFSNYDRKVIELMQNELNQSGHISNDNLQRWKIISDGWQSMVHILEDKDNKTDCFSPIFREQVWQRVWLDASASLDKTQPLRHLKIAYKPTGVLSAFPVFC